jgi:hypothetical protein
MANMEWNIRISQTQNSFWALLPNKVYRRANTSISGEGKIKIGCVIPTYLP